MSARTREKYILAVDFGSAVVRVAVAAISSSGHIQVLCMGETPTGGAIENGILQNRRNAQNVFNQAVISALGRTGRKPVSVFASAAFIEKVSLIKEGRVQIHSGVVTSDLLQEARESARQQCIEPAMCCLRSLTAEEWWIDDQRVLNPLGLRGSILRTRLHFAQIPLMALDNMRALVESDGFQLEDLVFSPIAAALGCITDEDRAMGVAVIDLGMKHTGLAFYQGSSLRGASDIDLGVDAIVADLMAATECHEPEARSILFEYGLAHALDGLLNNPEDGGIATVDDLPFVRQQAALSPAVKLRSANREIDRATICEIIAARVDEIFNHILAPIFQDKLQRFSLNRGIVLTGGGALIPKIADFVSAKYKIAARLGRPLEIQGWLPSLQTTAYTPLAGILVHAAHYEKDRADGLLTVGEHGQPESLIAKLARWISRFT